MHPDISVVITTYNSAKYIKETIDSIISQSFTRWELIIIDGGSTDKTALIVASFNDNRIKYYRAKSYLDIVTASQKGIKLAKGRYIALLDSDNLMHKNRLLIQYSFLEKNADVAMVGSWFRRIDKYGNMTRHFYRPYINDNLITIQLLFGNCIAQPTVLIRKNIIEKYGYRKPYKEASDYDLWVRISRNHTIINMPIILTYYRVHSKNASGQTAIKKNIVDADKKIFRDQFNSIKLHISVKELELHYSLNKKESFSLSELKLCEQWLNKLQSFNKYTNKYDNYSFHYIISCYWYRVCCLAASSGNAVYSIYNNSGLIQQRKNDPRMRIMLFILCSLRIKYSFETYAFPWEQFVINNSMRSYIRFYSISLPIFILGLMIRKTSARILAIIRFLLDR